MSKRDDRRRPLLWTVALLLAAAAVWLLVGSDETGDRADDLSGANLDRETRAVEILTAEGEAEVDAPAAEGPALVGRAEDPADRPQSGPVCVRVLGAGDHPLAGVLVEAVPSPLAQVPRPTVAEKATTDLDGEVTFGDLAYDGTVSVRVLAPKRAGTSYTYVSDDKGGLTFHAGSPPVAFAPVVGPEVILRTGLGLPLRVDVLSADTGRRVPGSRGSAEPSFVMGSAASRLTGDDGTPLAVKHGEDAKVQVAVDRVPDDHVLHDLAKWNVRIHPAARRLVGRMPLRPEAPVFVTFDEPEGVPAGTKWAPRCMLGKATVHRDALAVEFDAYGRRRLRGVPHLPGETLRVWGTYGDWGLSAKGRLPIDPSEPFHLHAKLTRVPRKEIVAIRAAEGIRLGGTVVTSSGSLWRITGTNGGLRVEIASFLKKPVELNFDKVTGAPPPPKPHYDVLVLGLGGEPVAGAQVSMRTRENPSHGVIVTTSKKGVARFEALAAGVYDLGVWGAAAPFSQEVTVPKGEQASVTVRADLGGTIHLFVVDEDGDPMPFARLDVNQPSKLPWADVVDGVQHVDPFADHLGRRILHNVEAGEVEITATLGYRSGTTTLKVPRGGSAHAQIVIDSPKPKPATSKAPK